MFARELSLWLAVACGGAMGAVARYGVYRLVSQAQVFPYATLAVNILGSAFMGAVIVWLSKFAAQSENMRAFLTVGILGAFTTFSTFALDAYLLYERKAYLVAGFYIGTSVILSIAALMGGMFFMKVVS